VDRHRSAPWWVRRLLFTAALWAVEAGVLLLLARVLDGFAVGGFWSGLAFVAVLSVVNAALWPLALWLTFPFAFFTLGLFTLVLNGAAAWLGGVILPGVEVAFWDGIVIAFALAFVQVVLAAVFNQADDTYDRRIVRRSARRERRPIETEVPGLLFLEIDGLAAPILERALAEGTMPHLAAWLADGSHRLIRWEPDLSSQTGASQAGILLGSNDGVVAFRWWDRERQRVVSCSSIGDVAALEERLSTGHGLLEPDGASRGNLFSGDAGDWMLTSSKIVGERRRRQNYFGFYDNAYNVPRVLLLMVCEVMIELGGQLHAWMTDRRPRIRPHASYFVVRAVTNVYLQLLTVYAVMRDVYLGVPVVYATFFAYDEVAHHSGISGGAAKRVLRRLDRTFARIAIATHEASRPYRMVILSDHGQSQGATFSQLQGMPLQTLVEQLAGHDVAAPAATGEEEDRVGVALAESAHGRGPIASAAGALVRKRRDDGVPPAPVVALASGCLGLVYFTGSDQRLTRDEIDVRYPGLVDGLVQNADIGFVMVATKLGGPVVLGRSGARWLASGRVDGDDPLADYPVRAPQHLARTDRFAAVPDILCNGRYDPVTGSVPAFEELLGSHGGLGGTQAQPFVFAPTDLEPPSGPIVGAEMLHHVLKAWAEQTRLRRRARDTVAV
jgi:uncharacterized membrane protein YvlD (DUF360 family)